MEQRIAVMVPDGGKKIAAFDRSFRKLNNRGYHICTDGTISPPTGCTFYEYYMKEPEVIRERAIVHVFGTEANRLIRDAGFSAAEEVDPLWNGRTEEERGILAINALLITGSNGRNLADYAVTWIPQAQDLGKYGHFAKLALKYEVPLYNLADGAAASDWITHFAGMF